MPNDQRKRNPTVKRLADLVDEDFNREWHRPGVVTFLFYFGTFGLGFLSILQLWAAFQVVQPISTTLFISSIATLGIALTLFHNSFQFLEINIKRQRFSRISKQPRFKSINKPRNEIILCSLIQIRNILPTSLREAIIEMPDVFREEKLLQYLLELK